MNWDAIGAIAELVGSLAVVITLIFLIIQLKYNSSAVRNSTIQNTSNAFSHWAITFAQDPEVYTLYQKGLQNQNLSRDELGRFDLIMMSTFQTNASIYEQYNNGTMNEQSWIDNLKLMRVPLDTPGGRASWARQRGLLPEKFREEIDSRILSASSSSST